MVNDNFRGHFLSVEDLIEDPKTYNIMHACNGYYTMLENRIMGGCVKTNYIYDLPVIKEGFKFKLPKIPFSILQNIISFFKNNCNIEENLVNEVMVQIYYNQASKQYMVIVPDQLVRFAHISYTNTEVAGELIVTIHSHPVFDAVFSAEDNEDERATGLYAVIGHLEKFIPDIVLRASIAGNFIYVPIDEVFENPFSSDYPSEWHNSVFRNKVNEI